MSHLLAKICALLGCVFLAACYWPKRKSWPKQRQVIKRNGQFYDA